MGSFMLCWKKTDRAVDRCRAAVSALSFFLLLLFALPGTEASASSATIVRAHAEIREGVVYLDVDLKLVLDKEMIDAMRNAIPLNLSMISVIESPRDWWFPDEVASDQRRYQLEYHALSKTWLVTDTLEHEARSFSTLDGALRSLQRIRAWPVTTAKHLKGRGPLVGRVRMVLDVNKLPLPLRLPALFDSRWSLNSDWFSWAVPTVGADTGDGL
ncbi:DUF4390 domain-containing protein [Halothiobacillus sp.]|uniref:DUF4390 domain-containing protein n=1 Tax=Halothiobacillus sp. TaxID=1891311 RepID=UPI002635F579|nr:DUF4390 domain-containing protein [Halothiobacillus sp.]MDD4965368.1 DUF4390 domain-containing protein [Halothiobacillus sp.]